MSSEQISKKIIDILEEVTGESKQNPIVLPVTTDANLTISILERYAKYAKCRVWVYSENKSLLT